MNLILIVGYVQLYFLMNEFLSTFKNYNLKEFINYLQKCMKCKTFYISLLINSFIFTPLVAIGVSSFSSLVSELIEVYL